VNDTQSKFKIRSVFAVKNFLVFVDFANNHFGNKIGNKSQLNPYIQRAVLNFRKRTKLSLLKNPDLLGGQLYQI